MLQRYYGYYANRTRGERRKAAGALAEEAGANEHGSGQRLQLGEVKVVEPEGLSYGGAKRRWAKLIRLIYEVDPLACPRCGGPMRVIALIQDPKLIDRILKHLRGRGRNVRVGP